MPSNPIGALASDVEIQILANQAAIMAVLATKTVNVAARDLIFRRMEETRKICEEQAKIRGL